ncbi:probable auxin efflux carrier component 1c [Prosopis cineraria]|uniref:probable auxin efflux carrier component 1c n=1 Tax=Prosopis cineraria TaxID=364024 RepID=UPI002410761D|nr:probable auxin efflux carrier component 1c [Prosopis cineraria]
MLIDFLAVLGAVVPLYVAIGLGYISVRWWKVLNPEQSSGINSFVSNFAIPVLVLDLLSANNPYTMNFKAIAADVLQKVVIFIPLIAWKNLSKNGSFDWVITIFGLSTLSNTLLVGLPLVQSMYGDGSYSLLVQLVVIQSLIWMNVLLALYEYRAASILIAEKFPTTAGSIGSVRVDPDVSSFSDLEQLETDAEVGSDGKLHVVVRSFSVSSGISLGSFRSMDSADELNLWATGSFPRQYSSRRSGSSRSFGHPERHYHKQRSHNTSRVADSSFDIEAIAEASESSHHHVETAPNSSALINQDVAKKESPPAGVVAKLIIITVWRKLIRNPNTYASVVGLIWSLIAFRFNIEMPLIIKGSITIISKTGIGMAMFSLGLFIALQPKIISIKLPMLVTCTAIRLILGPVVMAATSVAVGLHGIVFDTATVQAALPLSIVCFVFAKQYNIHPEIFSTTIIITTALFLPVTIVCYLILRLVPW